MIKVFGEWINPANVTRLSEHHMADGRITTTIRFNDGQQYNSSVSIPGRNADVVAQVINNGGDK